MKRIYVLLIVASICLKTNVFAQDAPYIGAFGGYAWPSGVFTDLHDFSYKPVNNVGIFAEFDRLDHLFMNTGFIYSQEESGPVTFEPEVKDPKDFTSNIIFDYLQLYARLKWSYTVVKHVNFYYSGGLYGGYLLHGSYTEPVIVRGNYTDVDNTITATDNMHKGNGGLLGGVGFTFQISKLKIDIGADANYSFFYTLKDLPYRGTIYSAGVRGVLGISYPLVIE